jgi:hypothetical protein
MSPDLLQHILGAAPPGCTIEIVSIRLPDAATSQVISAHPLAVAGADSWTPEAVVEWVRREHGGDGVKLKEWSGMLPGISHRELVRAAGDGRLVCHSKSSGKDHGARMASPDAMLAFLATYVATGSAA